ncbi:unnamed protein product [Haemonchus placei]|uniref:Alcohol dehydrogenase catalytic domain-containing protein n=1 Tax=Haemonchus placei TaxID=6290 RepID=A0A0N4W2Q2_HAEPC|nr:unnamed protein product [Haemonchus placei]
MSTSLDGTVSIQASAVAEPGTLVEVYRGRAPGAYVPGDLVEHVCPRFG